MAKVGSCQDCALECKQKVIRKDDFLFIWTMIVVMAKGVSQEY